jgi:hypothetical protein
MKEPYEKGVATHLDPESCAVVREGGGEALTGARVGWVLSREKTVPGADDVDAIGRQHLLHRKREMLEGWARSVDPRHARKHLAREPGDPAFVCGRGAADREGKSKDESLR